MNRHARFRTAPLALALAGSCLALSGVASATPPQTAPANTHSAIGNTQPSLMHRTGQAIDRGAITADVKARLIADSRTRAFDINVDTDVNDAGAIVTLEGTAPSIDAKRAATQVARQVDGVRVVHNRLTVTSDRTDNPQTMSAKAQAKTQDASEDNGHR